MARRRSIRDLLTPDPTPDKQLTHKSGWCMTSDHKGCKHQFNHGKCGCDCHTKPKFVRTRTTTVADDTPKRRGRPPKAAVMEDDPRPWRKNA